MCSRDQHRHFVLATIKSCGAIGHVDLTIKVFSLLVRSMEALFGFSLVRGKQLTILKHTCMQLLSCEMLFQGLFLKSSSRCDRAFERRDC